MALNDLKGGFDLPNCHGSFQFKSIGGTFWLRSLERGL